MSNVATEIGALEALERFVPGRRSCSMTSGRPPYRAQHLAETKWFNDRGRYVLQFPTSQGVVTWQRRGKHAPPPASKS